MVRSQYFDLLERKKVSAMLPKPWKDLFNNGIVIPAKMRGCDEYRRKILSSTCDNQVNENKEIEANLNLLKRKVPLQFG